MFGNDQYIQGVLVNVHATLRDEKPDLLLVSNTDAIGKGELSEAIMYMLRAHKMDLSRWKTIKNSLGYIVEYFLWLGPTGRPPVIDAGPLRLPAASKTVLTPSLIDVIERTLLTSVSNWRNDTTGITSKFLSPHWEYVASNSDAFSRALYNAVLSGHPNKVYEISRYNVLIDLSVKYPVNGHSVSTIHASSMGITLRPEPTRGRPKRRRSLSPDTRSSDELHEAQNRWAKQKEIQKPLPDRSLLNKRGPPVMHRLPSSFGEDLQQKLSNLSEYDRYSLRFDSMKYALPNNEETTEGRRSWESFGQSWINEQEVNLSFWKELTSLSQANRVVNIISESLKSTMKKLDGIELGSVQASKISRMCDRKTRLLSLVENLTF